MLKTYVKTGSVPKSSRHYLTADKHYLVEHVFHDKLFSIVDDQGDLLSCYLSNCCHLEGGEWEVLHKTTKQIT